MKKFKLLSKTVPKYIYYCKSCDVNLEVKHSIKEQPNVQCDVCDSSISLERRPGTVYVYKSDTQFKRGNRIGDLVKQTIQETHEDLKVEKDRLRSREIKNDK